MDTEIIELKDVVKKLDNFVDPLVGLLLPEQAAAGSVAHVAFKIPGTIRDYRLYQKYGRFITAIREKDLSDSINFSNQLFNNPKSARENALRLVQYIDKAETLTIIDYMVNASRAVGNQMISESECYRILWALTNIYPDDLHYFRRIATVEDVVHGNTQIIALAQNGLMINAGIDANRAVEDQDYAVTRFGVKVDRYALSFEDKERWEYWRQREGHSNNVNFRTNTTGFDEDILELH